MKKAISILIFILSISFLGQPVVSNIVYASNTAIVDTSPLPHNTLANNSTIAVVFNIAFSIIGAIAVLIVIFAGIKFITSSGKPEEIARAKDTIIYAGVGIIVCGMAVTIVSFIAGFI
jgi:hypothetical protein